MQPNQDVNKQDKCQRTFNVDYYGSHSSSMLGCDHSQQNNEYQKGDRQESSPENAILPTKSNKSNTKKRKTPEDSNDQIKTSPANKRAKYMDQTTEEGGQKASKKDAKIESKQEEKEKQKEKADKDQYKAFKYGASKEYKETYVDEDGNLKVILFADAREAAQFWKLQCHKLNRKMIQEEYQVHENEEAGASEKQRLIEEGKNMATKYLDDATEDMHEKWEFMWDNFKAIIWANCPDDKSTRRVVKLFYGASGIVRY